MIGHAKGAAVKSIIRSAPNFPVPPSISGSAFLLSPVSTVLPFDMGASSIDTHISTVYCMGVNTLGAEDANMKTTIEIDQRLLRQAQKTLGTDTIKGTVEASLRTVIQRSQLAKLADALGTIPLDLTPSRLRSQRYKRSSHVSR
jgi:Arc/MetJ family transcription regulator